MRTTMFIFLFVLMLILGPPSAMAQNNSQDPQPDQGDFALPKFQLSQISLAPTAEINNITIAELSGLAWDTDENLLYAVSDQGMLFHFQVTIVDHVLDELTPIYAVPLIDSGQDPSTPSFNAEGMTVQYAANNKQGDTELVVAVEDKPSRIVRFRPNGHLVGELIVPPPVGDMDRYRKKGQGLESVVIHPQYGIITAPEAPLKDTPQELHTLYAASKTWSFPRYAPESRLKALTLLDNGNLLVLERSNPAKKTMVASLREVQLKEACTKDNICSTKTWVVLPAGADNFEGLAKISNKHFLLVSDNGGKEPQDTIFVLITIL